MKKYILEMNKTKQIIRDVFKAILLSLLRILGVAVVMVVAMFLFDNFLGPTLIAIVVALFGVAVYITYKDIHQ